MLTSSLSAMPGALDPQLRRLRTARLIHESALLDELPAAEPGIYTLGGGRQVGKTTLLKQWMARLLVRRVQPERIGFLTGELIDDHHTLLRLLREQLDEMAPAGLRYVLLDEVTYIRDWDRAVKFAADAGLLEDVVLMLTGSDLLLIRELRVRLPGRRGRACEVDFRLLPLTFREAVQLKGRLGDVEALAASDERPEPAVLAALADELDEYLLHGGYLTAMNDLAASGAIAASTLATYSDWIRGDVLKQGKQERYLAEVLTALVRRHGSQVTWNALARDLSIDHPRTVADYVELLERLDVVFVQPALLEDRLAGAPKKARKVPFSDPFILHAIRAWLDPGPDPFRDQVVPLATDGQTCSRLVESCVAAHCRRHYPTFYIKARGEVDVAMVHAGRFWPVEVKWTRQLRPKEVQQIRRYDNGRILTRFAGATSIHGVPAEHLPLALLRLAGPGWPGHV